MKKDKIRAFLLALTLVFSMSLFQGCQRPSDKLEKVAIEKKVENEDWEESSDESKDEVEEESDKKEKASDSDKNNEDKDKENKDKEEEDNVKENKEKENKEKQAADKEDKKTASVGNSKESPSTGSISSNSAYDRSKLEELLKTNVALAKDTEVTIADGISMDELGEMALQVAEKYGFGGYVKNVSYSLNGRKAKIIFNYVDGKEGFLKKYRYVNEKVNSIVATVVKSGMSDYEKELALHDYIVNNTRYDYENYRRNTVPGDSYTAYGLLVNKRAVCSGYAEVMYRLLNKAGIEAHIVTGKANGDNHAWNLVKIGGKYYHLDATFNDPVTADRRDVLSYEYFNVTDKEIARNHSWNKAAYPAATATEANYFNVNKLVAKDYDEFCNIIKKGLVDKKENIMIKTTSYDPKVYTYSAIHNVVMDNKINYVKPEYSYSYDPNTLVFTCEIKYK